MSSIGLIIIGLVILVGVIGAVVQVWPSSPFIGGAIFVWAWMTGTGIAWTVFAIAAVLLGIAAILKYVIPARQIAKAGIPKSTLVWGGFGGLVGWFLSALTGLVAAFPFGLLIGMVAATYIAEYLRATDKQTATASTLQVLKAFGWSVAIELFAVLSSATAWLAIVIVGAK